MAAALTTSSGSIMEDGLAVAVVMERADGLGDDVSGGLDDGLVMV